MDLQPQPYIVYAKTDDNHRIVAVNSNAFLKDTTGWQEIDRGFGDKYHHAQGNYFGNAVIDMDGCHNYYLIDGQVISATPEQKAAEKAERPTPPPSPVKQLQAENNLLKAQVQALSTEQDFLTACLVEIGQVIYAE